MTPSWWLLLRNIRLTPLQTDIVHVFEYLSLELEGYYANLMLMNSLHDRY